MEAEMKRLEMRPSTAEDCKVFAKWEVTPRVREFFSMDSGRGYDRILEEFHEHSKDPSKRQFTLYDTIEERPIGRIYITRLDEEDEVMDLTRIYVGEDGDVGKGYGEEAMWLVMKFCFEEMGFHRLTLDHFTGNNIGANLYKKLGFKYEGVAREAVKRDTEYFDLHLMSLLSYEYEEELAKKKAKEETEREA